MDRSTEFLNFYFSKFLNPIIVVACSGGPDSMALLHLCISLRKKYNLKIICAHVNHNVREESAAEKEFVEKYCHDNAVVFEYMKIENYSDDNFENEARIKRYNYFDEITSKYSAQYLLTAHHGDDLIETILMRITRGSSLNGYSGFSKVVSKNNYKILRPLIYCAKKELIEYNKKYGIDFVIDKTNELDIHTRNRYRKYILPKLKEENINVNDKYLKFSECLRDCVEYIDKQINLEKKNVFVDNKLDIVKFKELDKFIQTKMISSILEDIYQDDLMLLTDKHIELINDLIYSKKTNIYVCLPNKINAVKEYNNIVFDGENLLMGDYEIELSEKVVLPNDHCIEFVEETDDNSNFICRLNSEEIKLPLIVRNRRDGDKMQILGLSGSKKIKDIFIDSKISLRERNNLPVVTDSEDNIVWLPGIKKSQFNKKKNEKYDIIIKYD